VDRDEWIELDLDVDPHAACVGSGACPSMAFRPTTLTEIGFEGVDLDQRLPNVDQRQGYHRRRGYARI